MYIILPGTMGYAGSWKYLDTHRRTIDKAKKLLEIDIAEKTLDDITPEQMEDLQEYSKLVRELIAAYTLNSDTEFSTEELVIPYCAMIADVRFALFVEEYFKEVYKTFNRLVVSSSEKSMRVRGLEMLLAQFERAEEAMRSVMHSPLIENLMRNHGGQICAIYPLDDLFVS